MKPALAAARASALALFAVVALIPVSAAGVSADANPANHGHHYGQLKHRPAPPPPVVPPVVVKPPAVVPPGAVHSGGGATGSQGLLPALQIKIDLPIAGVPGGYALARSAPPPYDGADAWLMLALVVSTLALWVYVFIRLLRSAGRWRANRAAEAAA